MILKKKLGKLLIALGLTMIMLRVDARQVEQEDFFAQANALYKQARFQEALKLYDGLSEKGSHVYYNMGNCAYKLGKRGLALLYWRRAEMRWGVFGKSPLLKNIEALKHTLRTDEHAQDSHPSLRVGIVVPHFFSFVHTAPLMLLQIIFLLLWLILFIYLKYLYLKRFRFLIWVLFAAVAFSGIALVLRYSHDLKSYGVVINPHAVVYSGPQETFPQLCTLSEAQEVVIKDSQQGFYKIKAGFVNGWVSSQDIEKI